MLDRKLVLLVADPALQRKQNAQWYRAFRGGIKTGPGYEFPCWECGEIGILGKDGFGNKGSLIRPRNIMHAECWEQLVPDEEKNYRMYVDAKHVLRRLQRHKSKRNLDRVAIRERTIYADYYREATARLGERNSQRQRSRVRKR